jgi:hypothetical protein
LTSHVIFSIQSITVIITVTLQPYLCSLAFEPAMSSSAFNPDHMPWSSMKWTEEAAKAYYEHRATKMRAKQCVLTGDPMMCSIEEEDADATANVEANDAAASAAEHITWTKQYQKELWAKMTKEELLEEVTWRTEDQEYLSELVEGLRECQQRQDAELKEQKNIIQAQQAYIDRLKQIVHQR